MRGTAAGKAQWGPYTKAPLTTHPSDMLSRTGLSLARSQTAMIPAPATPSPPFNTLASISPGTATWRSPRPPRACRASLTSSLPSSPPMRQPSSTPSARLSLPTTLTRSLPSSSPMPLPRQLLFSHSPPPPSRASTPAVLRFLACPRHIPSSPPVASLACTGAVPAMRGKDGSWQPLSELELDHIRSRIRPLDFCRPRGLRSATRGATAS